MKGYVIPTVVAVLPPGDATAKARADYEKVVFGLREKFAFGVRPRDPPSLSIEIRRAGAVSLFQLFPPVFVLMDWFVVR